MFSVGKKPSTVAPNGNGLQRSAENGVKKIAVAAPPRVAPAPVVASPAPNVNRLIDGVKQLALLAGIEGLRPKITEQGMALLDSDAACVMLPHGNDLEVAGAAGLPQLVGKRFPIELSLAGWVAKMGEMIIVPNIEKAANSWEKDLFSAAGYRSHLFLPIDWAGQRLAVLSVHSRAERRWSAEQLSLINAFCGFVAVALENAGLYREAEERAKALDELNQELQSALSIKGRFLGKISHELRSPLCVIMGYASLVAEKTFGPVSDGVANAIERILTQANTLMTVLTYTLEVSQLDDGKLAVRHGAVEIAGLLDEATAAVPRLIGDKPIEFCADYNGCRGQIRTDLERLIEVLMYVLGNAAKFTDRGKIVLSASVKHKLLQITVADTGIGMDAEQQKIIFDGFRQADENDTP